MTDKSPKVLPFEKKTWKRLLKRFERDHFFFLGLSNTTKIEQQRFPRKLTVKTVLFRLLVLDITKKFTGSHDVTYVILQFIWYAWSKRKVNKNKKKAPKPPEKHVKRCAKSKHGLATSLCIHRTRIYISELWK